MYALNKFYNNSISGPIVATCKQAGQRAYQNQ
jgi:hypothetical protein